MGGRAISPNVNFTWWGVHPRGGGGWSSQGQNLSTLKLTFRGGGGWVREGQNLSTVHSGELNFWLPLDKSKSLEGPGYVNRFRAFTDPEKEPRNVQFRPSLNQILPKSTNCQDSPTCRGWLGLDTNRKNPKSPKMGLTTQKLS